MDWVQHANTYGSNAKGLLVRRTMPELDDIIRRSRELYTPLGAEWLAGNKTWMFPNGAELRLRFLETEDDASRYQGHAYNWIGLDEAGNYPTSRVIDMMRACLRDTHGVPCYLRLTGNPGGPGHDWLKARFVTPSPPGTPFTVNGIRRVFIPSRLADNPHLSSDLSYADRLRGSGPAHLVKAWLEGSWDITPDGGFFKPDKIIRLPYSAIPKFERVYQSWDCAVSDRSFENADYSACATIALEGNSTIKRYWILDIVKGRWNMSDLCDQIIAQQKKWKPMRTLIEGGVIGKAIDPFLRQYMQRTGVWYNYEFVQTGRRDKVARAGPLQAAIEGGSVYAPEDAAWWHEFAMEFASFPTDGVHDDVVDACSQVFLNMDSMLANNYGGVAAKPTSEEELEQRLIKKALAAARNRDERDDNSGWWAGDDS